MFGIIYIILCIVIGWKVTETFWDTDHKKINIIWGKLAASWGIGVLLLSWTTYMIAFIVSRYMAVRKPLYIANGIVMLSALIIVIIICGKQYRAYAEFLIDIKSGIKDKRLFHKECIGYGILFLFILWTMYYVFHIKNGILYSGFTVYGDYAPHTAMMRSFSWGNNFPTQYPHYGGQDVKYHFMFQFLTGNLEFLGIPIDVAYNLTGTLSLWAFLVLLSQFFRKLFGAGIGNFLVILLFFFRSGTAVFEFIWKHLREGNLWQTLKENTAFIGYTPNENWGLWNYNVYLNQRHLAFGMLIALIVIWIYTEWLECGCSHTEIGIKWLKNRFFSKGAWQCKRPEVALLMGMLLGLTSFWNGAAVIAGLLILMGMAIFSDGKLDYVLTAIAAVSFSMLQSKIFVHGSVVSPAVLIGFISENKSIIGIFAYLMRITGLVFIGCMIPGIYVKMKEKCMIGALLFPVLFTFIFSLTPDVTVNHKYIMISYAFMIVFWAYFFQKLLEKRIWCKVLTGFLIVCFVLTGIYDFGMVLRGNNKYRRVAINMESNLSKWLADTLDQDDLILTPEYSMSETTMAGVMLYCGWPYYAWSAGYDTMYRAQKAIEIYTTEDRERLTQLVQEENIDYILFEEGMEFEENLCKEELIQQVYERVYISEDNRVRIYQVEE